MRKDVINSESMGMMIDTVYLEQQVQSVNKYRRIHINEEVDNVSMFKAMYGMDKIKDMDDQANIPMNKRLPIEIVVNSYGGYCYEGLALISKILHFRKLGYEIVTICSGKAMSMGFMIFIVGSHRILYKYGTLMCHQVLSGAWGKYQDMAEEIEETKMIFEELKSIIKEYTDITEEQLVDITKRKFDWFIRRDEALKLKIADEIQ